MTLCDFLQRHVSICNSSRDHMPGVTMRCDHLNVGEVVGDFIKLKSLL